MTDKMRNEVLFSVVIPAFNAEKTIARCLDSILKHNFDKNIEILIVNDGSSDGTQIICQKYTEKYDFIKLLNQKNEGASAARNFGLQNVSGKWIVFVDVDDIVDCQLFVILNKIIDDNHDIYVFDFLECTEEIETIEQDIESIIKKQIMLDKHDAEYAALGYTKLPNINTRFNTIWAKCFKAELILKNHIQFYEDIKIAEDLLFDIECFEKATAIAYYPYISYYYINNQGSATRRYRNDMLENNKKVYERFIKLFSSIDDLPELDKVASFSVLKGFLNCIELQIFHHQNHECYTKKKQLVKYFSETEPYKSSYRNFRGLEDKFSHKEKFILKCSFEKRYLLMAIYYKLKDILKILLLQRK